MTRIDRYVLAELGKRLVVALLIVLVSLVIERILRLFDLVSLRGGPIDLVWQMAAMLVPHYLGLAIPAGFFVSTFLAVARFHHDSEFDAVLAAGISPSRFARPFVGAALVLALVSLGVFGYAQPYTRYGYRAVLHLLESIPWDARVPEMAFSRVEDDATVTADRTFADGRMERVFIHYRDGDAEITLTAASGVLDFGPMRAYYRLDLADVQRIEMRPDAAPVVAYFSAFTLTRPIATTIPPFRDRGADVRELTLDELAAPATAPKGTWTRTESRAEFHGRTVRSVSLVVLPFLALPLALAARRSRRNTGLVIGALLLLMFHYTMQTLQGLAAAGRLSPLAMWAAMAAFAAVSAGLFWRAQRHPGENPLDPAIAAIEAATVRIAQVPRRAWRRARR